jgi:allantoicase
VNTQTDAQKNELTDGSQSSRNRQSGLFWSFVRLTLFPGLMQSDRGIMNGRHFLNAFERSILVQTIEKYFQLPRLS